MVARNQFVIRYIYRIGGSIAIGLCGHCGKSTNKGNFKVYNQRKFSCVLKNTVFFISSDSNRWFDNMQCFPESFIIRLLKIIPNINDHHWTPWMYAYIWYCLRSWIVVHILRG